MTTLDIPTIDTPRLRLRAFTEADFPAYQTLVADADVMRYLGDGRPLNEIDAWRQLAGILGHWLLRGFGLWAVDERSTGRFVGRVGLLEPSGWPGFEVAYTIATALGATCSHSTEFFGASSDIYRYGALPTGAVQRPIHVHPCGSTQRSVCREQCLREELGEHLRAI